MRECVCVREREERGEREREREERERELAGVLACMRASVCVYKCVCLSEAFVRAYTSRDRARARDR